MLEAPHVEATALRLFPFRHERRTLALPELSDGRTLADYIELEDGHLGLTLHLLEYDEGGSLMEVVEMTFRFDVSDISNERWAAYVEGFKRAYPSLMERVYTGDERNFELLQALSCSSVLRDAANVTADDFERAMKDPSTLDTYWRELYPHQPPTEEEYQAYLETARPEGREEVLRRRAKAYENAMALHPRVAERLAATHGFVLPKHVALTWAFFSSLSEAEWELLESMDIEMGYVCGVFDLFKEGGLERKLKAGFDARMHEVRDDDPPELLLMVQDSSDRYALFYDDPGHIPSGVVCCPRHGPDEWWAETYLDGLRARIESLLEDPKLHFDDEDLKMNVCRARLVLEALDDFAEHAERIRLEDRAGMLWPFEARRAMAQTACGVGIATSFGDASGFEFAEDRDDYQVAREDLQAPIPGFIARAREELDRGDPRYALALGRDLHCSYLGYRARQGKESLWQKEALELMVRAYTALGRDALARRAEVHHANRGQAHQSAYED